MTSSDNLKVTDTANANCRELLDIFIARGIDTMVISPGSRNTPLLIAASAREKLRKIIITDERTAAFVALGISMVSRRPTVLVCTSGTAMYNYAPAIAEAFYQKIPLIVVTADRPMQWIDQDDSQTLRQPEALSKIVKRSFDISAEAGMSTRCSNTDYETEREWFVNRIANEAAITATSGQPGPVHVNMQFANPLNLTQPYAPDTPRIVETIYPDFSLPTNVAKSLGERLYGKKIMVVAGFMPPDNALNKSLIAFSQLPNVTLLAETISNLHIGGHAYMVDTLLTELSEDELHELRPDIVITIGGALVSRKLKEYLRSSTITEHWTLGDTDVSVDCLQRLTTHIDVSPAKFFNAMTGAMRKLSRTENRKPANADYRAKWQSARERIWRSNQQHIAAVPYSELKALNKVFGSLTDNCNLFLSNGTCVRYAQILLDFIPHACYSNRGVSGIDGTNATALGVALASKRPTVLVTGDMSFAYCPEVLNLMRLGADLRIVVVNNAGGGIFRFIPTTRDLEVCEEYFCTDPELPIEALTRAYGRHYMSAANESELTGCIERFWRTPSSILEIKVDPTLSAQILRTFLD